MTCNAEVFKRHKNIFSETIEKRVWNTVLICAVKYVHETIVDKLLELGCRVHYWNAMNESALDIAIEKGHASIVKKLIAKDYAWHLSGSLKLAHEHNRLSWLLNERTTYCDETVFDGQVRMAAGSDEKNRATQIDWIKIFIQNGANVNARRNDGETVLMHAVGSKALVEILLQAGADLNARRPNDGYTALTKAVGGAVYAGDPTESAGCLETIPYLLEQGACFRLWDFSYLLSSSNNQERANKVFALRANKVFALLEAQQAKENAIFDAIRQKRKLSDNDQVKVNLHCRNADSDTPLLVAARCGNLDALIQLISLKHSERLLDAKDEDGKDVFDIALSTKNKAIIEELIFKFPERFASRCPKFREYRRAQNNRLLQIAQSPDQVREGIRVYMEYHLRRESQPLGWGLFHSGEGQIRAKRLGRWNTEAKSDNARLLALQLSFYDGGSLLESCIENPAAHQQLVLRQPRQESFPFLTGLKARLFSRRSSLSQDSAKEQGTELQCRRNSV